MEGEREQRQLGEPECRRRKQREGGEVDRHVRPTTGVRGGDHAQRDPDQCRHHERRARQQKGRRQALENHVERGPTQHVGHPEVQACHVGHEDPELLGEGSIKAELGPHFGVVRGIAVLAGKRHDRVARRKVDEQEADEKDPGDRERDLEQAPGEVASGHGRQVAASANWAYGVKPMQGRRYARVPAVSTSQTYGWSLTTCSWIWR